MAEAALLVVTAKIGIAVAQGTLSYTGLAKKAGYVAELPSNMRVIKNDLELIRAFLKDIGRKGWTDRVPEIWIGQARRLAYEMEDIVDQFIYVVGKHHHEASCWGYVKKIVKKPKSLLTLDEIATALNMINRELIQLKQNTDWFQPIIGVSDVPATIYDVQHERYLPGHDYSISDDNLVGLEESKKALMKSLKMGNCSELQITALWGMGGIGKSTLVSHVFEASKFECKAWVSVSQSYKIDDIWISMLKEINKDGEEFDTKKMGSTQLTDKVKEILGTKRYLIVLDDVWTAKDFFNIKHVLVDNGMRSRVIITTRTEEVASVAHDGCKIKVEPLEKKDAWLLFRRKAFPTIEKHICPGELHEYAHSIMEKCGGLPLALVTIGSILSLKAKIVSEWRLFRDQVISELHNNDNISHVEKILNLSYRYLPDYLKNCFLYCAMFPEDHMIHRKRLIRMWIAEGFIEQVGACSLEDVAEGYLLELVQRSMLHVVKRNSFNRIKCVRMHDLVRELAIFQSKRESFSTTYDDSNGVMQVEMDSRRLLRTLITFSTSKASSSLFPSESKYLAVLELSGLPIETIPNSIGELFNLRYLGLDDTKVKVLPNSVTNLHNLETLSLQDADCLKCPRGSQKLKRLRNILMFKWISNSPLTFESYESMEMFDGLWNLKELRTLDAIHASDVFIAKLVNLSQLRTLAITGIRSIHCAQLCHSLSKLHHLSLLEIRAINKDEVLQLETLTLSNCLKKLSLAGRFSEGTFESPFFSDNGDALHKILLNWSQLVENPLPRFCELKILTEIQLRRAYTGQEVNFHPGWFPAVKNISLEDFPHVNQICIHEGALINLEEVEITGLVELRDIPTGLEHLKSLKEVWFSRMHPDFVRNLQTAQVEHLPIKFY
uniref:NBS-LRR disease resistance protein n=1 Tax=Dasypyrum villosum TaxID=40247 RepID=A0A8K1MIZ5_9POAL|nr:NBS-LRR disease resistance protein [Dasypyrum villosum]